MGYSERVCHLCGASFNVARIRRADEAADAAWMYYGYGFLDGRDEDDGCGGRSTADTGCRFGGRESRWGDGEWEHLAGPRCVSEQGYSGWRIGAGELKPMTRVQCILRKDETWTPEPDDAPYEAESKCFVTGVSQNAPDEFSIRRGDFLPVRHGVSDTNISNCGEYGWGIPFHAQCFEIYKRVCVRRFGEVDIDALWELRELEGDYGNDGWDDIERCPELQDCRQQWWQHEVGTEWLVADPITIPFLQQKLQNPPQLVLKPKKPPTQEQEQKQEQEQGQSNSAKTPDATTAVSDTNATTNPSPSPTPSHSPSSSSTTTTPTDPFTRLSNELLAEIMLCLAPHDVAALRLSSRAFTHLPDLVFKHFIRVSMPWLWEIDSLKTTPTTSAPHNPSPAGNPSSSSTVRANSSGASLRSSSVGPRFRYRDLHAALKPHSAFLRAQLGLRNRRRIWGDVVAIVEKVARLREQGEKAWEGRRWRDGEDAMEDVAARRAGGRRSLAGGRGRIG
ncbi:uncharacterized protein K452DRAFT_311913 [Aplosporella prunicola CBS 121167]|uniref:Uncharacterized protein n=1 Tax=Aplosporella prunicola CBS 121167 TaxID=1176127 RepID=A0A6A6B2V7_9PEZI|nr:uncharacterized protein K452DRAFT_311913 [Aplosporella prunicola CBS 121167]KAF2138146.1 hypothetical protein K452DRAFT_311913 [Aplosporella prunicola CBS 121167]